MTLCEVHAPPNPEFWDAEMKVISRMPRSIGMLDRCVIRVHSRVRVNPEVFKNRNFPIGGACLSGAKCGYRNVADGTGSDGPLAASITGVIDVFEDGALRVHTVRHDDSGTRAKEEHVGHLIDSIHFNAAKILYGHNGRVITTPRELCVSLMYLQTALSHILEDPEQSRSLIPGLNDRSSYWQSLEIPMNLDDPGKRIFRQMGNMRSPGIRGNSAVRESNTVYQRGTNFVIKAYDKVAEMKSKSGKRNLLPDKENITRLEVELKSGSLRHAVGPDNEEPQEVAEETGRGASFALFDRTFRLTGFNIGYLKYRHRMAFENIRAVFWDGKSTQNQGDATNAAFWQRLVGRLCVIKDIEFSEVFDLMKETGGRGPTALRDARRIIEKEIAGAGKLVAKDLLSDANYSQQPAVTAIGSNPFCKRLGDLRAFSRDYLNVYGGGERRTKLTNEIALMGDWLP